MIRLPPTTILLGRSDLKEFDRRRKRRDIQSETEAVNQEFGRLEVGGLDDPSFAYQEEPRSGPQKIKTHNSCRLAERSSHVRSFTLQIVGSSGLDSESNEKPKSPVSLASDDEEIAFSDLPVDEHNCMSIGVNGSPENVSVGIEQSSSSSKDDFYFGGFTESPMQRTTDNTRSSFLFGTSHVTSESKLF